MTSCRRCASVDAVVVDLDQDASRGVSSPTFDVLFRVTEGREGAQLEAEMAEVGARVVYLLHAVDLVDEAARYRARDFSDEARRRTRGGRGRSGPCRRARAGFDSF